MATGGGYVQASMLTACVYPPTGHTCTDFMPSECLPHPGASTGKLFYDCFGAPHHHNIRGQQPPRFFAVEGGRERKKRPAENTRLNRYGNGWGIRSGLHAYGLCVSPPGHICTDFTPSGCLPHPGASTCKLFYDCFGTPHHHSIRGKQPPKPRPPWLWCVPAGGPCGGPHPPFQARGPAGTQCLGLGRG